MPKGCTYAGKSILQKGHLLSIPSHLREAFNIAVGDSLEMHVEGNMLILKPVKEAEHRVSGTDNLVWLPLKEEQKEFSSPEKIKFPLRLVEGRIYKVV